MTAAAETSEIVYNGHRHRVWSQGTGRPLGFLPGVGGLPRWTPFLTQMAATRRVIAPSLPGFPGASGHEELDSIFDWILATRDILAAAGLEGADLMAVSVSGALLADVCAVWPGFARKLILLAPFGLFDVNDPMADIWAQRPGHLNGLLCAERETYKAFVEQPDDADPTEWKVEQMRALEASARYLFPTGNTGLAKRLHRIQCPVLLARGAHDQVLPASYLARFAGAITGVTTTHEIAGAGHLADLDQPDELAALVTQFLE